MKILIISHMYPSTFNQVAGIFVHQQVKELIKQGCEVKAISPVPWSPFPIKHLSAKWRAYTEIPKQAQWEGVEVCYPRYIRPPGRWFHSISSYTLYQAVTKTMNLIIDDFQPHILHTYAATPDGYAGLILKRRYKLPLVCSLLGSDINVYLHYKPFSQKFTQRVISETNQLIAVSQALKYAARTIALPKHEIKTIYMGCDLKKFKKDENHRVDVRATLSISAKDVVLLFVGGLFETKGVFDLLDAFAQLHDQYTNLRLIFVGAGPVRNMLRRKITSLRIEEKVHLIGARPHEEIPRWLSASDIFVLPSYREGVPNVVVEAMACGRPVVATRVGGIPEAVEEGKSGILLRKGDVKALVEAIIVLLEDEGKRQSMGVFGKKIVENKFTWEKSAEKIINLYKEILKNE